MADLPDSRPAGDSESPSEAPATSLGVWDDLQLGFNGNAKAKLDERGRLKLPTEFKNFVERKYGKDFNAFYITSMEGDDAEIYTMPEWQQHMAKIFRMPKSHPSRIKLLKSNSLYGDRVDMDPQGRLLFPEELRRVGMVNLDVRVSGEENLLRVVSLQSLRDEVKANRFTEQDMDAFTEYDV